MLKRRTKRQTANGKWKQRTRQCRPPDTTFGRDRTLKILSGQSRQGDAAQRGEGKGGLLYDVLVQEAGKRGCLVLGDGEEREGDGEKNKAAEFGDNQARPGADSDGG